MTTTVTTVWLQAEGTVGGDTACDYDRIWGRRGWTRCFHWPAWVVHSTRYHEL